MDLIKQLGPLALASRLKRLSDRLMRDGFRIYREQGLEFEPRWFTVFYLLSRKSPLAVTEISHELQITHPAVNQVAGLMEKAGLILSRKDKTDERKRLLSLSPSGKVLAAKLKPIWKDIKEANQELLDESGKDLLGTLEEIESALDETEMFNRIMLHIKRRQAEAVDIIGYKPQYRKYFKTLNLEWLKKYFSVEPVDDKLLSDPEGEIIRRGGLVLFARVEGKIVGTAALIKHSENTFELAKMAVTEKAQGRQVGRRLVLTAIDRAKKLGARIVFLNTNPKLTAANNLYRSLGFVQVSTKHEQSFSYQRPTVTLKLIIEAENKRKKHQ